MNCKENFFGLVAELLACPPESISISDDILNEKKYILSTDYAFKNQSATFTAPMKSKSAECSESSKEDLPGTSYEVNISWQVENPTKEELDRLQKIKEQYNHLIIKMFGDNESSSDYARYFVYSSEDGYRFEYNENKGVLECKLSIVNLNGLQRVFAKTLINSQE